MYIPATVSHALNNASSQPLHVIVMGFRTKGFEHAQMPPRALSANIRDVPTQMVSGHPSSTLYRLLMGDVDSKRNRIAAGRVLTSLFLIEGMSHQTAQTYHHHEREEEIYLVLDGHGDMVAGGGLDGVEGRHPAKAGDASSRLNCAVGSCRAPRGEVLGSSPCVPGLPGWCCETWNTNVTRCTHVRKIHWVFILRKTRNFS